MNRTIKTILSSGIGSLTLSALAFSALAFAGHGGPGGGGRHGSPAGMIERHAEELKITPATVTAIKNTFEAARPELDALREKMHAARKAEHEGKGTAADVEKAGEALRTRHLALRAQIDGMLTPAQREGLQKLRREGGPGGRHGEGRGPRGDKSPPAAK